MSRKQARKWQKKAVGPEPSDESGSIKTDERGFAKTKQRLKTVRIATALTSETKPVKVGGEVYFCKDDEKFERSYHCNKLESWSTYFKGWWREKSEALLYKNSFFDHLRLSVCKKKSTWEEVLVRYEQTPLIGWAGACSVARRYEVTFHKIELVLEIQNPLDSFRIGPIWSVL